MLAWRQVLDHVGLALLPLCSLSQQCSRCCAEGAEALSTLDRCVKQDLKELVRQNWVSRPKPVYETESSWNKIGNQWTHGSVWEDFKREGGRKVCLEVLLVVGRDFFFLIWHICHLFPFSSVLLSSSGLYMSFFFLPYPRLACPSVLGQLAQPAC